MAMDYGIIIPQGCRMDLVNFSDPVAAYEAMTRVALEAEDLGFRSIWLYDHFLTVPVPTQEVTFECWTSSAALARDTQRVRIGHMVTCNSYRNPALLAKMASTIDVLSHGRLDVGIGAGWYEREYLTYGYAFPGKATRFAQLGEAVQILLKMWTEDHPVFEGKYYSIHDAINSPKGVQKSHIPLLIGGGGEKVTLRLVAQYANACNVSGDIATIKHKFAVLKRHCDELGCDYNSIRRTTLINDCAIADTEEAAIAKLTPVQRNNLQELRRTQLIGSPAMIRQRLAEYEEVGVQELIIRFVDAAELEPLRLFAQQCMHNYYCCVP